MSQLIMAPAPPGETLDSLVEQGQAAERAGLRDRARTFFEAALRRIDDQSPRDVAITLTRWIARTYIMDGDLETAADCATLSLAIAEAQGDAPGTAHALNALGSVLPQRGELEQGFLCLDRARLLADEMGDNRLRAMIDQNLGIAATIRGDFPAALLHYQASLDAFRAEGMDDHASYVLNNRGMLFTDLERWPEAEEAFDRALESAVRAGNVGAQIMVGVNRTELEIAQKSYDRAAEFCDHAFKLARRTNDLRALSELHKHYAIIARETDQLTAAEAHLSRALALARQRDDLLLAAEIAREEAELFWMQGRNHETLRSLNKAHQLFARLHAKREIADIDGRMSNLEAQFVEIVKRWGESIESADQYTQGHCMRVADYACELARDAGLDRKTLFWFRLGALLHDVGKIVVPAVVLNKPAQLTDAERAVIERHPDAGVALLADIEFPWDIRPMVRHHHERWEGGGYPTGIAGDEIPLAARILCIADVFDALTSERPYRAGFSQERALDIMTTSMASHFDPALLQRWRELCAQGIVAELARVSAESLAVQSPGATPEQMEETPCRLRVLVISRNFADAALLRSSRLADGSAAAEVSHVATSHEAMYRLRTESFDAVVVGLPLHEGHELTGVVQLQEKAPELPALLIGNLSDQWLSQHAIRHGAQDFLLRGETTSATLLRALRFAMERNRLRLDLQSKSLLDDLTGLYNRRGFFTVAAPQLKLADRRKERLAVVFADVNGFKQVNDQFGHREGDLALVDITTLLKSTFRQTDTLARLGGDEFVALVPNAGPSAIAALLDRLDKHLDLYNSYAGRRHSLGLSLGSSIYDPSAPTSIDELLREADKSMYEQKQEGCRARLAAG
ncbi:MAG: diguanylate cyclase [Gemmatimonadetes bacterium]|nr:diguanylate cyclase [Gemmatimonadota bacterium]